MKARLSLLAVPLMFGVAFAQSSGSASPAGSQSGAAATTSGSQAGTTAASASNSGKPAELKTITYKGTLVDLGCGASSQNTASTAAPTANTASANRSTGDTSNAAAGSGCAVSSNTSQFGLKTDAGQTYRFDMVGNQRAQDEFKNNKHWSKDAGANKPLKVKISGVVQGDKIIVSSIH